MKKYIVFLCLLLILVPTANIMAANNFQNMELTEAIEQIAELKSKNVLFLSEPQGKIDSEINLENEFSKILVSILSSTNYQFVEHNEYYIIGLFSNDSAEFAKLSDTVVYETKYLTPDILIERLDYPGVKIKPSENKGQVIIQGLPEDIKKVKEKIVKLDKRENFPQVQYEMTLIDITKESNKKLNLEAIKASSEKNEFFEFYQSNNVLEIILNELVNSIEISASDSYQKSMKVANPGVVTEIGTTGTLEITEELLTITEEDTIEQTTNFITEITPQRIASDGKIKTDIRIDSNQAVAFSTNLWLVSNKTELIGLLSINKKGKESSMTGRAKSERKRTYAIYITAKPVTSSPAAQLNGLDKIIFADYQKETKVEKDSIKIMANQDFEYDLDLFIHNDKSADIFTLKSRESNKYLEIGYGLNLRETLALDLKGIIKKEDENELLLGMSDKVYLTDNFQCSAGYYPVVYLIEKSEFNRGAGYLNLSYQPNSFLLNLRYNHNLEIYPYKFDTGFNFNKNWSLLISVKGDQDKMNNYLAGIKYNF